MDTDSKAQLENGWLAAASQASTGDATHQDPPPPLLLLQDRTQRQTQALVPNQASCLQTLVHPRD